MAQKSLTMQDIDTQRREIARQKADLLEGTDFVDSPRATRAVAAGSEVAAPTKTVWGRAVSGVKTIVKWAVVAVVAVGAYMVLSGLVPALLPATAPFFAGIDGLATQGWNMLSGAISGVGEFFNQLWSGASANASSIHTLEGAHSTATLATTAAAGTAVAAIAAKKMTALAFDPNVALMPDELAIKAANNLGAAGHAAGHHTSIMAEKAAHVAADKSHEHLHQRSKPVQRILAAKQQAAGTWAERAKASEPNAPKGIV